MVICRIDGPMEGVGVNNWVWRVAVHSPVIYNVVVAVGLQFRLFLLDNQDLWLSILLSTHHFCSIGGLFQTESA